MPSRRFVLASGAASLAVGLLGCTGFGQRERPVPSPKPTDGDGVEGGRPRSEAGPRADADGGTGGLIQIGETVAGVDRTALLQIPTGWTKEKKWPLVIVSHGSGGTANVPANQWGFAAECDRRGWIGVFPNTGREVTGEREDLYFPVLVERLVQERSVNPSRVYAAGFSGGQGRVYTFGAKHSDLCAAIAGGGGKIGLREMDANIWDPRLNNVQKISVLHFHGKKDPKVPVEGGTVLDEESGRSYTIVPMREGLEMWAEAIGATPVRKPPPPPGLPTHCSFHRWKAPTDHVVEGIVDPDLGHSWPSWGTNVTMDFFDRVPAK